MTSEAQAELFYAGAMERIRRYMLVLAPLGVLICLLAMGWRCAMGFASGSAIAYINFHWLKRVVSALADRVTRTGLPESGRSVFTRFLVRYALIALAAYVIFRVSLASLYGLFAGLFLPVAAIGCEAAYEAYIALRRGL
jgi:ATP synthase I chain